MGVSIFLSFMFLVMFSVSSTQLSKANVLKLGENREPLLIVEEKNEVNQPNKQGGSHIQGKPGVVNRQGHLEYSNEPGHFTQRGKPEVLNQPGMSEAWILQRNSADSNQKGNMDTSNKQRNAGSVPQVGKPGTSSQQGNPGSSSPQSMSNSLHSQEGRQNVDNSLKGNMKGIQTGSSSSKNPNRNTKCQSVYKPVCGSDGKTYGNLCVFNEAKRLSKGKLNLNHEGKC